MEGDRRAAFFDRDGTLIEDVGYLSDPNGIRLVPGAAQLVRAFNDAGFLVVVASNQSGIARGLYGEYELHTVNKRVAELLNAECGASVDAWYHCPHHPDFTGRCNCRKPKPGMLVNAAYDLNIDLSRSFMFGDKKSDIECGCNAGCAGSFYVSAALAKCCNTCFGDYVANLLRKCS